VLESLHTCSLLSSCMLSLRWWSVPCVIFFDFHQFFNPGNFCIRFRHIAMIYLDIYNYFWQYVSYWSSVCWLLALPVCCLCYVSGYFCCAQQILILRRSCCVFMFYCRELNASLSWTVTRT